MYINDQCLSFKTLYIHPRPQSGQVFSIEDSSIVSLSQIRSLGGLKIKIILTDPIINCFPLTDSLKKPHSNGKPNTNLELFSPLDKLERLKILTRVFILNAFH